MFAWMAHLKIQPGRIREFVAIWQSEIVPELEKQEGNISAFLIDLSGTGKEFLSISVWNDRMTALKYHSSIRFNELTSRMQQTLLAPVTGSEIPIQGNVPY
jgi:heme-degrading monooxygenase HmoA